MKLKNASISILINRDYTTIELHDEDAAMTFIEIKLTPEHLSDALSRLAHVPCKAEIIGIDKIGKKMEHKTLEFEIPENSGWGEERRNIASKYAKKACPEGWEPDNYFGSQNSFFSKDEKQFARCIIRRYV
jgi:hypothetical protein